MTTWELWRRTSIGWQIRVNEAQCLLSNNFAPHGSHVSVPSSGFNWHSETVDISLACSSGIYTVVYFSMFLLLFDFCRIFSSWLLAAWQPAGGNLYLQDQVDESYRQIGPKGKRYREIWAKVLPAWLSRVSLQHLTNDSLYPPNKPWQATSSSSHVLKLSAVSSVF